MSEIKWVKITTDMFNDEKIKLIERMPEGDTVLIIWIKLLVQAGKTNASGYIFLSENIPYTEEMLSTIFDRPLSTVRMALNILREFGMIEIDEDYFIRISNWEKHQNVEGMQKIREQNRLRAQKYRQRLKKVGGYSYLEHYDEVYNRDNGECVYCGSKENFCLDHLVPVIKGGDNEIDNIVLSCKRCNSGLAGKLIEETNYTFFNKNAEKMYENTKRRLNITPVTDSVTQRHATDIEVDAEEDKEGDKELLHQQANRTNAENPFTFYQENFGVISPFVSENIFQWSQQLSDELVVEAMKTALKNNRPFSYAEGILKDWYKKNIRTLQDVEAERMAFEREKMTQTEKRRSVKDEIGESSY